MERGRADDGSRSHFWISKIYEIVYVCMTAF